MATPQKPRNSIRACLDAATTDIRAALTATPMQAMSLWLHITATATIPRSIVYGTQATEGLRQVRAYLIDHRQDFWVDADNLWHARPLSTINPFANRRPPRQPGA